MLLSIRVGSRENSSGKTTYFSNANQLYICCDGFLCMAKVMQSQYLSRRKL